MTTCFSICERQSPLVPEILLCKERQRIIGGYPKIITFSNVPGIQFSGKMQPVFNFKKIGQFKSDIQSCRCKSFSFKQVSGLIRGVQIPWTLPLDPPVLALAPLGPALEVHFREISILWRVSSLEGVKNGRCKERCPF